MKLALRGVVLLVTFAGVGLLAARLVLAHAAVTQGVYRPETRLTAAMAGLFAGGVAAVIAGIAMIRERRR